MIKINNAAKDKKNTSNSPRKAKFGGMAKNNLYGKGRKFHRNITNLPFTEFDFYDLYRKTIEKSEFGMIGEKFPLQEEAKNFALMSKSMRPNPGRRSYFTSNGKVAQMFLKMYTGLNSPMPME